MSLKRSSQDEKNSTPKKVKNQFDIWKTDVLTPPATPNDLSNNKLNYNLWQKDEEQSLPIKINDLIIGFCTRTIQFRVSLKSLKRPTKNGDMFHFFAFDDKEIQVTAFPDETKKFFDLIAMNRTYQIKYFNVKPESKEFPSGIDNSVYICLNAKSVINEIDDKEIPSLKFDFKPIDSIVSMDNNSKCDLLGIIGKDHGQETTSGGKLKREVTLTDKSKSCINLTIWGDTFNYVDFSKQMCVIIRNGIISDFMGVKFMKCGPSTMIWFDPELKIASEMKEWFDEEFKKLKI